MSFFGKLVKTVVKAITNPPPRPAPVARPNPAPPYLAPVVATRPPVAARPVAPASPSPARPAPARVAPAIPPLRPVIPWIPNETPNLLNGLSVVQTAIANVDSAIADVHLLSRSVWWKGNDADSFRERCRVESIRLNELRQSLLVSVRAIDQAAANESQRARAQSAAWA
jgi:hypothetical protein